MDAILAQHLAIADPFGLGLSGAQMSLGFPLVDGQRFPVVRGGFLLSRRDLYPSPGPWYFAGFQVQDALYVTPPGRLIKSNRTFPHGTSKAYQYRLAAVLGNGFVSKWSEPIRIDVDGAGALITAGVPLWPLNVNATPIAGGKYRVRWTHSHYGSGRNAAGVRVLPYKFEVYEGADADSIDYGTPLTDSVTSLAYTLYGSPGEAYSFTTPAYADGTVHAFAVRSISLAGHKEVNEHASTDTRTSRATAPEAPLEPGQIQPQGSS